MKKNGNTNFDDSEKTIYVIRDYYQGPFLLLHDELHKIRYDITKSHQIRKQYWSLILPGYYSPIEARDYINGYLSTIEYEMRQVICKNSIAYWLHLYRRLFPGPTGKNAKTATIFNIRAIMEAAFQKYGDITPCNRVGDTATTPINKILGGILMSDKFTIERKSLEGRTQLVLTDFSLKELIELYELEKLAYELWRASAMLRIVGKGAPIVVTEQDPWVFDARSMDLDFLVSNFDSRNNDSFYLLSSTGIVFNNKETDLDQLGIIIAPVYNIENLPISQSENYFKLFDINFIGESSKQSFNFNLSHFALRQFRKRHQPFADAYKQEYGVKLDAVLLIISSLWQRIFFKHVIEEDLSIFMRMWQRSYEGPYTREFIISELYYYLPFAYKLLDLEEDSLSEREINDAINFWMLKNDNRLEIDLIYPGPHYIFLPYGNERFFIDYVWIIRRLYDLFLNVNISDQNFKGSALEELILDKDNYLPTKKCKAQDGTSKQIDASFIINDRLIIIECKVRGKSIGFSRGDTTAINYRNDFVNDTIIEVDKKAQWLASHPKGRNYDISHLNYILPIVVSPFTEYIPSIDTKFWLTDNIPRVITPYELIKFKEEDILNQITINLVKINS